MFPPEVHGIPPSLHRSDSRLSNITNVDCFFSDQLAGTSAYGSYGYTATALTSDASFSVAFSSSPATPMLFATGDRSVLLSSRNCGGFSILTILVGLSQ